jgi:hypothetical protein
MAAAAAAAAAAVVVVVVEPPRAPLVCFKLTGWRRGCCA